MWWNMKARVVFILLSFERKKKRKIDIKIKNKLFVIKSKLPGVSNRPFPPMFALCRNCPKPLYWVGFVGVLSLNAGERRSLSESSNPAFRVCIN